MCNVLKSFYFCKKKVDVWKGIFFLFYQIVIVTLFLWKNVGGKSLENHNFTDFSMKTVFNVQICTE